MESRQFRLKRLKMQIRLFLPLLFLFFSLLFLGLWKFDFPWFRQLQTTLMQGVSPIVSVVSAPLRWGDIAVRESVLFFQTYQENKRLRSENESLHNWRNVALQAGMELQELKELLNYVPPKKTTFITARVLADNGGQFARSLVVSAGSDQGVSKGDVAMTQRGVFGRVVEVGANYSRLMLLTDYASKVPVAVGGQRIKCLMSGDNGAFPKLAFLPENTLVQKGDVVMTSGQVGVYPSGLGIGVVSSVENGEVEISLFEQNQTPDFVRLVNFGLNDVLLSESCASEDKK